LARKNKARFAALGILSHGPASGYDMKIMMQRSTDNFWKEGDASIYPILKQLLKEKLITLNIAKTKSPRQKKIYTITKSGMEILQDWLKQYPEPSPSRNELLLKVFFGWNVDSKITIEHIEKFRGQIETTVRKYRSLNLAAKAKNSKLSNQEVFQFLTLRAGIVVSEACLQWCDESLQLLNKSKNIKPRGNK
jgi:PadR family transcriptional regulator, regulatory protein AphA